MNNMFCNASYGDRFKTRNGKIAIFIETDIFLNLSCFVIEDTFSWFTVNSSNGCFISTGEKNGLDILCKIESVDYKEIDRLALDYLSNIYKSEYKTMRDLPQHLYAEYVSFKAGYKKAKDAILDLEGKFTETKKEPH